MRIVTHKLYRAFPELDRFDDERCQNFVRSANRGLFRRYPALAEALLTRWKRYNDTRERIFALEAEGKAHVFAPELMPVDNSTRSLSRLAAAHRMGLSQARRELSAIKEFLGADTV